MEKMEGGVEKGGKRRGREREKWWLRGFACVCIMISGIKDVEKER